MKVDNLIIHKKVGKVESSFCSINKTQFKKGSCTSIAIKHCAASGPRGTRRQA